MTNTNYNVLKSLCENISQYEYLNIPSPTHQKRRAAVAIILRWFGDRKEGPIPTNLEEFFNQIKESQGQVEILFMQRTSRVGDRWSGHVSFIGGKNEQGETDRDTVKREVFEEVGLDLNDKEHYVELGQLDHREISSIRDNKLLMILVPFVYLQISSSSPPFKLQDSEVAAVQWIPLSYFLSQEDYPSYRPIDENLNMGRFRSSWFNRLMQGLLGSVQFPAYHLPTQPSKLTLSGQEETAHFRLWGLTLGMTNDLIELTGLDRTRLSFLKPSRTSFYYSRPDIGFFTYLIACFRYRSKQSDLSNRSFTSTRLNTEWDKVYFSSIKNAVIVSLLFRAGIATLILSMIIKRFI